MKYETEFELKEEVRIIANDLKGIVAAIWISEKCIQYCVEYVDDVGRIVDNQWFKEEKLVKVN